MPNFVPIQALPCSEDCILRGMHVSGGDGDIRVSRDSRQLLGGQKVIRLLYPIPRAPGHPVAKYATRVGHPANGGIGDSDDVN